MIYAYLMGGLGNQMFIIATALSYGFDTLQETVFSNKTNENMNGVTKRETYENTFLSKLKRINRPQWKVFSENGFNYRKIVQVDTNIILFGYFQSARYFNHHKDGIINYFMEYYNNEPFQNKMKTIFDKFNGKTVSLHIRRTDYLNHIDTHPVQSIEYYINAIKQLDFSPDEEYTILIFSDDIEWCKNNEQLKNITKNVYFSNEDELTELYMMSKCNHNIICNSSFSWWGAYLNKNPDKKIVAPKQWFGKAGPVDWSDIYTEDMIIL